MLILANKNIKLCYKLNLAKFFQEARNSISTAQKMKAETWAFHSIEQNLLDSTKTLLEMFSNQTENTNSFCKEFSKLKNSLREIDPAGIS